ncbi:hypothetical protein L209DRAFT_757616 [Thermothelomyces heterothallicus CBS 203.75]
MPSSRAVEESEPESEQRPGQTNQDTTKVERNRREFIDPIGTVSRAYVLADLPICHGRQVGGELEKTREGNTIHLKGQVATPGWLYDMTSSESGDDGV